MSEPKELNEQLWRQDIKSEIQNIKLLLNDILSAIRDLKPVPAMSLKGKPQFFCTGCGQYFTGIHTCYGSGSSQDSRKTQT